MDLPIDERIRLAVPSDAPGGLSAARSGYFGSAPFFTIVDVVDGAIVGAEMVRNRPHHGAEGYGPVALLSERQVDAVIVTGIGHQPLLGCVQAGIRVFAGEDRPDVRSVVQAFADFELSPVGIDATCRH